MGLCQGPYNQSVHNGVSPDILSTQSVQCTYTLLTYYTLQLHYDVTTNSVDNGVWPDILSVTQYTGSEPILVCIIHAIHALCNCTANVHARVWSDILVHCTVCMTIRPYTRLVSRILCHQANYLCTYGTAPTVLMMEYDLNINSMYTGALEVKGGPSALLLESHIRCCACT